MKLFMQKKTLIFLNNIYFEIKIYYFWKVKQLHFDSLVWLDYSNT